MVPTERLKGLEAFVATADAGSFTAAAERLNLTNSAVGKAVSRLEARLNTRLFERTTRSLALTDAGAAFYRTCVRVLDELQVAEQVLAADKLEPLGRLRVDVPSPLARLILVPALPDFHARHPEIQLDLGVSDRMVDIIGENVDCVLRGGELTDQSLMHRHIADLPLGVYAAPRYLALAGVPAHPRELEGTHQRIVGFHWARHGRAAPYEMQRGAERLEVRGRYALSVDDGNAYIAAGVAGMGVLWLPEYMAQAHRDSGELVPLFEDWQLAPMPLYLAFAPQRHVSAKLRAFMDWVTALMERHAPVMRRPVG